MNFHDGFMTLTPNLAFAAPRIAPESFLRTGLIQGSSARRLFRVASPLSFNSITAMYLRSILLTQKATLIEVYWRTGLEYSQPFA